MNVVEFDISKVLVSDRQKRPLHNIDKLVASIQDVGLLHPIVVGTDGKLKVGFRRLTAYKQMGCVTIPAHITDDLNDVYKALKAERDENIQRDALPPSVLVDRARELDEIETRLAKERQQVHGGTAPGKTTNTSGNFPEVSDAGRTRDKVAAAFGISGKTYEKAKKIVSAATQEPDAFGDLPSLMDESSVNRAHRELVKRQRKDSPPLPSDKFRVLYADPPWSYGNTWSGGEEKFSERWTAAETHYPSMTISELCAMGNDIKDITESNAVLFLWVTSPLLEECFPVIKAWGFKYKTSFVWDKVGHNFGHYNSVRHEFLLVCTRGSCTPDVTELVDSVQSIEKSRTHSEKPEEFRTIIDTLYPHGKRLELFARTQAEGWEVWGNELRKHTAS